jgi:hypothetical protein
MTSKTISSLAFAAGCALALGATPAAHAQSAPQPYGGQPIQNELITNGPQASAGDHGNWSARRNNAESRQYTRLLETNPGFRRARMRKECGPINDPQLHRSCIASFQEYSPRHGRSAPTMVGSSTPPASMSMQNNAGYSANMDNGAGYGSSMPPQRQQRMMNPPAPAPYPANGYQR